jgi:putative Mg2+ transporter-C (MgtC) family protein
MNANPLAAISIPEMLLRVGMAFLAGCIVGWERQLHGRPAGLRTNILACVASAISMVISEVLFAQSAGATGGSWRPDPARLGQGILTGIGFLGAGTILRHGDFALGVTTAASLWFVTVLGLAFGAGQYAIGFIGLVVALLALLVLPEAEKRIRTDWYATLTVTAALDGLNEKDLRERIEAMGLRIEHIKLSCDLEKKQNQMGFELQLKRDQLIELSRNLLAELAKCPGVLKVEWA